MLRRSPMSPRRRWLLQTIVGLVTLPLSAVPIWIYATHTSVGELLSMKVRYRFMPPSTPQLNPVDRTVADAERARAIRGVTAPRIASAMAGPASPAAQPSH